MSSYSIYFEFLQSKSKDSKYIKYYENLIRKALNRAHSKKEAKFILGYVEGHHIVPSYFGEEYKNDKNNIVYLTAREHFLVHLFLLKSASENTFHQQKSRETIACFKRYFTRKHHTLNFTSRQLDIIRSANSIAASLRNVGNKNYLFRAETTEELKLLRKEQSSNSKWVNDGINEYFTEKFNELLIRGYILGRIKRKSQKRKMTTEEKLIKKENDLKEKRKRFEAGVWVTNGVTNKRVTNPSDYENDGFYIGRTKIILTEEEIIRKRIRNTGSGNPTAKLIHIYNEKDELQFECLGNFKHICKSNNLPQNALGHSYSQGGKKILLDKSPTNKVLLRWANFVGWWAKIID